MRPINKIIIHCSASSFGNAALIDQWHRERGFAGIGYHYVILNGVASKGAAYRADKDGRIETGRPLEQVGAHCRGHNRHSLGVCLIGGHHFSPAQLTEALPKLAGLLLGRYGLTPDDIYGHADFTKKKTCPNIKTAALRGLAAW